MENYVVLGAMKLEVQVRNLTKILQMILAIKNYCKDFQRLENHVYTHKGMFCFEFSFLEKIYIQNFRELENFISCHKIQHRSEAELPNTFSLVSWDHVSPKTFETMIIPVIDTFKNTTPAVNQKFVRRSHTVSYSIVNYSIVFSGYAILLPKA